MKVYDASNEGMSLAPCHSIECSSIITSSISSAVSQATSRLSSNILHTGLDPNTGALILPPSVNIFTPVNIYGKIPISRYSYSMSLSTNFD